MLSGTVGDYDNCPDWKFGQVLQDTTGTGARLFLVSWVYRVDYNWHESIFKGVAVASGAGPNSLIVGDMYEPYCGWWRPVDD
jgi:hypothetical protein